MLAEAQDFTERGKIEPGKPILEHWAAWWALAMAAVIVIAVGAYQLLPGPRKSSVYTRYQPPQVPPQ